MLGPGRAEHDQGVSWFFYDASGLKVLGLVPTTFTITPFISRLLRGRCRAGGSGRWILNGSECQCGSSPAGRLKWNEAPRSGFVLAQSRPSWASMIERQIANPMPMPCGLVV